MTRQEAREGSKITSEFEPAIDEMISAVNRIAGLVNFSELSEIEQNETEQLRILCEQYLEELRILTEEGDIEDLHIGVD